jgi:hypothetical protein
MNADFVADDTARPSQSICAKAYADLAFNCHFREDPFPARGAKVDEYGFRITS